MNLFELMEAKNESEKLLERYKQVSADLEKLWNVNKIIYLRDTLD